MSVYGDVGTVQLSQNLPQAHRLLSVAHQFMCRLSLAGQMRCRRRAGAAGSSPDWTAFLSDGRAATAGMSLSGSPGQLPGLEKRNGT